MTTRIPNSWRPRGYQLGVWKYLEQGGKRASLCWHRRSGKDTVCLNWEAVSCITKPATYWHMLPIAEQARKAIWSAVNPHTGQRIIDQAFPPEIRSVTRENEMFIRFVNGATWQMVGSDNYDRYVGSPPVGVVFSEYALAKPSAWVLGVSPILLENGGWAIFNSTPRGMNHFGDLHHMALKNPDWYAETLPVTKTGVFSDEQIDAERREGKPEEIIEQEYYCSFTAAILGAYYGKEMRLAKEDGRVGDYPWVEGRQVHTAWDIGFSDDTSIWFFQVVDGQPRFIDFHVSSGRGVDYYVDLLASKKYQYADPPLWLPHDAQQETMAANGRSVQQQFRAAGFRSRIVPSLSVQDGIQASRMTLRSAVFNEDTCSDGIRALELYQRKWREEYKRFDEGPVHDWTSHPADAFRMACVAWKREMEPKVPEAPKFLVSATHGPTFNQALKLAKQRRIAT